MQHIDIVGKTAELNQARKTIRHLRKARSADRVARISRKSGLRFPPLISDAELDVAIEQIAQEDEAKRGSK